MAPLRSDWSTSTCPIARSLDVVGDPWIMLILREAMLGSRRYEQFRSSLGAADNVLSRRLQAMVDAGLLERVPYRAPKRTHHEYRLTEAGTDLLPILHALVLWGEKHTSSPLGDVHLSIVHTRCGQTSSTPDICSHCGDVLRADEVAWHRPWRVPELTVLLGGL
jgi:DNA-binding HxlR family transcriptional regulator